MFTLFKFIAHKTYVYGHFVKYIQLKQNGGIVVRAKRNNNLRVPPAEKLYGKLISTFGNNPRKLRFNLALSLEVSQ